MTNFPTNDSHDSLASGAETPSPGDDPTNETPTIHEPATQPEDAHEPATQAEDAHEPATEPEDAHEPATQAEDAHEPATESGHAEMPPGPQSSQRQDSAPRSARPSAGFGAAPLPIRRLYRSRHDRKLGGVSGGIAEFFRIDSTIVRLVTLVLAFSGIGIIAYLVGWAIIPLRPQGHVDPTRDQPIATERTMTIAVGVATIALAIGIITGSWVVLAFALVGGGLWLLSENAPGRAPAAGYAGPDGTLAYAPPPPHAAYQPSQTSEHGAPHQPPQDDWSTPEPAEDFPAPFTTDTNHNPPRERTPQRVTWIVLSLLMLLTALGLSAVAGDWWDVRATHFLGAAIVIIAVGVVVGQLRGGGARGLIPLGVLATLALFPVTAVDGLLDDGVGAATYRPSNVQQLESSYEHGIGQLTVDLSQIDLDGRSQTIDIELGIGELIVIVSNEAGGQAALEARAGEVSHQLPGNDSLLFEEGINASTGTLILAGDDGTLDLNINVGFGTAELRTAD